MIFSRGRGKAGRHSREPGRGKHARGGDDTGVELEVWDDPDESDEPDESDVPAGPDFGPYDVSQAPDDGVERLDLGSLRVPVLKDVEIHLQAGPEGQIQQILLVHGESRLQLAAFAAPRSAGIWDEMRADLRTTLTSNGAKPEEIDGEYGPELRARVRDADGTSILRFVGVDGPRWLVHGVYRGVAAADPDQAGRLRDALRGLVVDRGAQAMPVSEALPLRLPPEAAAQLGDAVSADTAPPAGAPTLASAMQGPAPGTKSRIDGAAPRPGGRRAPAKRRER